MKRNLICSCELQVDYKANWTCPKCHELNGVMQHRNIIGKLLYTSFIYPGRNIFEPCINCGLLAAYGICPSCGNKILINSNGDKQETIKIAAGFLDMAGKLFDELKNVNSNKLTRDAEDIREVFSVLSGKKDLKQVEKEKLQHELEKEEIYAKIRKIKGEDEKKKEKSAFSEYEKKLKDEKDRIEFQQEVKIINALGTLGAISKLEKMKVEALQKIIEKYLKENKVNDTQGLPVEILLRLKKEIQETEDMFDKMMSAVRRAASV